MSEHEELNKKLADGIGAVANEVAIRRNKQVESRPDPAPMTDAAPGGFMAGLCQWAVGGSGRFVPTATTSKVLPPGLYAIEASPELGLYFRHIEVKTEGLLRLPHTNSDQVLAEVQNFWDRRARFDAYGLAQKRGILLWGPPGSGKSCTIQLVMKDVVERGGIGILFGNPGGFVQAMRMLREIQPDTPVVVLMEDIEMTIQMFNESDILNVLDGAERLDRVVFLASTNYPEMLGPRIVNRPSRFDRRFKIPHPNEASRAMYLVHLTGGREEPAMDVDRWSKDSEGMSLAHLRELFVAVVILEHNYDETLEQLLSMRDKISSEQDRELMGIGLGRATGYMLDGGPKLPGIGGGGRR